MRSMVPSTTPVKDKDSWRTPDDIFTMLNRRWGPFTLDAAATEENKKCDLWLGPGSPLGEDALEAEWQGVAFLNPPYSQTAAFVWKAWAEVWSKRCERAVLLLPATTDVRWFHEYVWGEERAYSGVEVDFSCGRIRFLRPDGSKAGTPTHGSMFVCFHG